MDYTTDYLVTELKETISLPSNQSLFLPSSMVKIMDRELQLKIVPLIMAVQENYFLTYLDTDMVLSQAEYDIPTRAIGNKLKDIQLVDGNTLSDLSLLTFDDIIEKGYDGNGSPEGFIFKGDKLVLYPSPDTNTSGDSLRQYYFRRPNHIIETSDAMQITSIDSTGLTITCSGGGPTDWEADDLLDIINQNPPFNTIMEDATIATITNFTITLSSVTGLSVGDWVAKAKESPIPQIPVEASRLMVLGAAAKILRSLGDEGALAEIKREYDECSIGLTKIMTPRVDDAPKKIVSRYGIW